MKRLICKCISFIFIISLLFSNTYALENQTISNSDVSSVFGKSLPFSTGTTSAQPFDAGWKFFFGNPAGAEGSSFADSGWQTIDVPLDFIISQTPASTNWAAEGFFPGGTGWYRKHFTPSQSDSNKKITIEFESIYHRSDVYYAEYFRKFG